ncbi:putative septum site-determining protein MinC [uncultured Stenotrophomonas sp.]|uniref:Probable septum site-determining protein MinC n=1 Tax=uncultured Stenotrophomonas sp. TaxID=165438 RepID=A0A1Y5Q619_9GAMM|nr:putative septum site-determining protein MinC [uncultured Stenotrophomonas sp.]
MAANPDYEQAGDLKIGQVGVANLRIRTLDVARLVQEMRERVARAPKLFGRAAVILDFGGLSHAPDTATARALLDGLREAGVLPVALAYGTSEIEQLSVQLGLPLLSKFRAQYESADATPVAPPTPRRAPEPAPPPAATAAPAQPGRMQLGTVRSGQQLYADPAHIHAGIQLLNLEPLGIPGQQLYAENCDLTVISTVGAGAEVIADGSIHIYGTLRGRALAGAKGNEGARIFCRDFHAELVAIAGRYKVLDDIPDNLRGKAVQVWLEQDQIMIAALD